MLYDSVEEANNRLLNTIVTYADEPVYVAAINRNGRDNFNITVWPFPFDGSKAETHTADDPLFKHFQSPPIGFCNYFFHGTSAIWCERTPSRQRRQGLSGDTFSAVTLKGGNRLGFNDIYTSDAFREMVRGEYPSFDEAFRKLIPSSAIAVDREFAIRMTEGGYVLLYYKRDEVGIFVRDNLYLRADRQYLAEMIAEHPNLPDRVEVM